MNAESFTLMELFKKAAECKGLKLREGSSNGFCSEPIKTYFLDEGLLAFLAEKGIKGHSRPDCRGEIFTLEDGNFQEPAPGYTPSNYWNFKLGEDKKYDLRVSLYFSFLCSTEQRGIILYPGTSSSFLSPADRLPNFRMFKALTEKDSHAPAIAKELARSDGRIIVTWTELGLGGIRKLADLFTEFAGSNEAVRQLGVEGKIFNPIPYPRNQKYGEELFIAEPAQPKLFAVWRNQVVDYTARLAA